MLGLVVLLFLVRAHVVLRVVWGGLPGEEVRKNKSGVTSGGHQGAERTARPEPPPHRPRLPLTAFPPLTGWGWDAARSP